jgi:hypothetical protein
MRFVSAFVIALGMTFAAGCGDDSTTMTGMDLSASGDTCLQVVMCGQACAGNVTCENACAAKGSTSAVTKYQALFGCAYGLCTVAHDGGTAACSSNTDSSTGCLNCVISAAMGASCSAQLNACIGG